jgi:sigma-B regulation protein RsbU (phosphoserine phosphatase)
LNDLLPVSDVLSQIMSARAEQKSPVSRLLHNLKPATPMGWAWLAGVAVWFIDWTLSNDQTGTLLGSAWLKRILDVASVLALIPLAYFIVRETHRGLRLVMWRLRQRLIITYFLIGVLPLTLLLLLLVCIGLGVELQSGLSRVARQLDGYLEQSQAAAQAISRELNSSSPEQLKRELKERADALSPVFPGVIIRVQRGSQPAVEVTGQNETSERNADQLRAAPEGSPDSDAPLSQLPGWIREVESFHGLAVEADGLVFVRHVIKGHTRPGAQRPAGGLPEQSLPLIFELRYPLGAELCAHLSHTTGLLVMPRVAMESGATGVGIRVSPAGTEVRPGEQPGFPVSRQLTNWQTGERREGVALFVDSTFLQPGRIIERIGQVRQSSELGNALFTVIAGLAMIFLMIASVAVISAAFLTRTITGAVHQLYIGTKRVEAGDLNHIIPAAGNDQLSELALSFNQMTQSVRELLRVSAEKQKLDQEMKIAAEVQSRLFPRTAPKAETLDISPGICIPARAVSGDYYDFLDIAPGVIGLVIADVCGKGMSAALLMSNLQASLRGQAQAYRDVYQHSRRFAAVAEQSAAAADELLPARHRIGQIVERVNRQIENSTADSRYVTMFYAEIDAESSILRYTNAGHNAPLLLRYNPGSAPLIERLDCGGTVLGLFSGITYEEAELKLHSGDLLVACTDGVIEAHNPQGEEFGEERLAELLISFSHLPAIEIERLILQAVRDWTSGADQEDDLTLMVVKRK